MKLSEYCAQFNEVLKSDAKMKKTLRNAGLKFFKDNNITYNGTDIGQHSTDYTYSKRSGELFRVYLNSDKDDANKETLERLYGALSDGTGYKVTVHNDDWSSSISGRNDVSHKYFSYAVDITDEKTGETDVMYITNKNSASQVFSNKALTPNKLLPLSANNKYDAITLADTALNTLRQKYDGDKYKSSVALIEKITGVISDINNYTKTGAFNATSTDELFNNPELGTVTISANSIGDDIKSAPKNVIASIEKDYGEILGGIMFGTIFEKCEIMYPTASNEALIDYYIDGHKVSAKQAGSGGKPSGTNLFANINNTKHDALADMYDAAEMSFIDNVASTYKLNVVQQQVALISKFVLHNNELTKMFKGYKPVIAKPVFTDEQVQLFESINDKRSDEVVKSIVGDDPKAFFDSMLVAIQYKPTNSMSFKYHNVTKEYWDKCDFKYGALVYPLWKVCIDIINNIYNETGVFSKDAISSVINKQIDMRQVYLSIKPDKLNIKAIMSKASKWRTTTGGISATNITNAKLSVMIV